MVHTSWVREVTNISSPRKPKNARSKRVFEAREPKEVEDSRTVIFVKGTHSGERLNGLMAELVRPNTLRIPLIAVKRKI